MRLTDKTPQIRLVAVRASGAGEIYTLQRSANSAWSCTPRFIPVDAMSDPLAEGTFVVDRKSAMRVEATRHGLSNVLDPTAGSSTYLINGGSKGVKTFDALDGDRIGRVDWGGKMGNVKSIHVIEKLGQCSMLFHPSRLT